MNETELSKSILDAVNALPGVLLWRSSVGQKNRSNRAWRGRPDLVGYCGKYFLAFEVKTAARLRDRTSATYLAQVAWREKAAKDGAAVHVVSSVREATNIVIDMFEDHAGSHPAP